MHWVVTTGRDVPEATERALEALGIHESELEFVVLDEPGTTLFGLRPTPARIRARVRPTRPRPKLDRRQRRKGKGNRRGRNDERRGAGRTGDSPNGSAASSSGGSATPDPGASDGGGTSRRSRKRSRNRDRTPNPSPSEPAHDAVTLDPGTGEPGTGGSGSVLEAAIDEPTPATGPGETEPAAGQPAPTTGTDAPAPTGASDPDAGPRAGHRDHDDRTKQTGAHMSDISIDEQEPTAKEFLTGLLDAFGADASVESVRVDDDTVELNVTGEELGLLVGQRGSTLNAVNELVRTAVAQQHNGRLDGRLRVDIAGYRARRKEALARFATQQAEKVRETGQKIALEPMSPPDRKVVHDTVNEIDGVRTSSQGEDRRRHVVIHPED